MDSKGNTPMHFVTANDLADLVQLLDSYGADATLRNKEGNSSIDIAISGKHKEICLYFGQSDKYRNFIKSNRLDEIIENITGEKIPDLAERPNFE